MKKTALCIFALTGLTQGAFAQSDGDHNNIPSGLMDAESYTTGAFDTSLPRIEAGNTKSPGPSPSAFATAHIQTSKASFSGEVLNSTLNSGLGGNAFRFVHLTDLHIGEGVGDYGTEGVDDAAPAGDVGGPARKLREAVNWINANKDAQKISFVMVTGDITDSGERSEFIKAKEILDALTVPYIPMLGNHDVWPYTADTEAAAAIGDEYFNNIFKTTFDSLRTKFAEWNDGTRLTRTFSKESDSYHYFQNFSFSYRGYHFMCADFNARSHAPFGNKGVGPEGDLYNFTGGTWQWFTSHYNGYPGRGSDNMLLFAHHPMTKDIIAGVNAFSPGEYNTIASFLNNKGNKNSAGLWLAGHVHRNKEYGVNTYSLSNISPGIETGASKEGNLRLITVLGAK